MGYHFAGKCDVSRRRTPTPVVVVPAIDRAAQETVLHASLSVLSTTAAARYPRTGSFPPLRFYGLRLLSVSAARAAHPHHCPVTITRRFLTWAVNDAVARGELSVVTQVEPLVDTLAAVLSGIGFFAAFIGRPRMGPD